MNDDKQPDGRSRTRWVISQSESRVCDEISRVLNIKALTAKIIARRGISTLEEARRYYKAGLSDLSRPELMAGMGEAVERIVHAVRSHEKICVYGDYDVDGITSTALAVSFLRKIGADATYYIPKRGREGYGLNNGAISMIAGGGVKLLIAVDCGIGAVQEIAHAAKLGMDVVVVDHHQVPDELPKAAAILNPHRPDCGFPFKDLAAVGVTFFLMLGLRTRLREDGHLTQSNQPNMKEFLDLVALGTVADVVPLLGDNRILVKHGLKELAKTKRPGLVALKDVAGIGHGPVTARMVGFGLAPRINAAGRLDDAQYAVEMMLSGEMEQARAYAEQLNGQNAERQKIEEKIYEDVNDAISRDPSMSKRRTIVMASEYWHQGVIGIVAARIARRFYRPTILFSVNDGEGRGSGRSIEGFHIFKALGCCSDLIKEFGGHKSAAGMTVKAGNISSFSERFEEIAGSWITDDCLVPHLELDAEMDVSQIDEGMIEEFEKLEPYGMSNPPPLLLGSSLRVIKSKAVGQGNHLKLKLSSCGKVFDAICFGVESRKNDLSEMIDVAFCPEFNEWMGARSIQLRIQDFRNSI